MDIKTRFEIAQSVYLITQNDDEFWCVDDTYTIVGICIIVINCKTKITYSAHRTASNDFGVYTGLREHHLFSDLEKAEDRIWMLNEEIEEKKHKKDLLQQEFECEMSRIEKS